MEDKLIEILESFGYPVYRQGTLAETEKYPDSFFTFWNNDSPDHSHYDNSEYGTEWFYDVNFYSNDPELTHSVLNNAIIALKKSHWIVPSKGYDVMSDEVTHTGRGVEVYYLSV